MILWEQVLLGESIINTLCHMIFHYQTHLGLASSMARQFNHGFLVVGLFCKAQGLHPFQEALNIDPKHTCLCGNKFYWVSQSLTHFVMQFSTCFPKALTFFRRPQTLTLNIYVCVGTSFFG